VARIDVSGVFLPPGVALALDLTTPNPTFSETKAHKKPRVFRFSSEPGPHSVNSGFPLDGRNESSGFHEFPQ